MIVSQDLNIRLNVITLLVVNPGLLQASLGFIRVRLLRDSLTGLSDINTIQLLRKSEISIHNIRVEHEKVSPSRAKPGILIIKTR